MDENEGVAVAGNEELILQFSTRYKQVAATDLELLRTQRKQVDDYWELGKVAAKLKAALKEVVGHGNWLEWLDEHGYVERTVQRAMKVYANFKENKDGCLGLTIAQAESTSVDAAEAANSVERAKKNAALRVARKAEKFVADERAKLDAEENELAEAAAAGETQAAEMLLTESVAGGPKLKDLAANIHEGHVEGEPEDAEPDWNDLCEYACWMADTQVAAISEEESQAIENAIIAIGNPERALQVMLVKCLKLLNDV